MVSALLRRPQWQIALAIVFFAQLMTATGFSLVFPFLPLYVDDLGSIYGLSTELLAGLVIGVQGFTMMVVSPLWGAIADRHGRKLMVMRAQYGGAVILLMMAFAQNAEHLIVLRGIQGMITGTVAANSALIASKVPRDRIGFAMGSLQVGLWGGLATGPLIGGFLADAYGFAMPFYITALLLLISGVLIHVGVEENFTPVEDTEQRPGLVEQWQHVLGAEGVPFVYTVRFLTGIGRMMIIPIAPLFVASLLPDSVSGQSIYAGLLISVSSLTATLSGVYLGKLGDRIGHRIVLIGAGTAALVLYIPQVFVTSVWQLIVLQGLAGLAMGGLIAAPSALLAQYTQPGEEGAVYGIDSSVMSGSRAVAPIIGGMIALWFGYRGTFALTALFLAAVAFTAWQLLPSIPRQHKAVPAIGD